MNAENTAPKQRGKPFRKGTSGNPKGKPRGALNHSTRAALVMMHGQLENLTHTVINKALEGDMTALRLIFDKILPQARESPIESGAVTLPELSCRNMASASAAIFSAVADGRLTPTQGKTLSDMLDTHRKVLEIEEIEERLTRLENAREQSR